VQVLHLFFVLFNLSPIFLLVCLDFLFLGSLVLDSLCLFRNVSFV